MSDELDRQMLLVLDRMEFFLREIRDELRSGIRAKSVGGSKPNDRLLAGSTEDPRWAGYGGHLGSGQYTGPRRP